MYLVIQDIFEQYPDGLNLIWKQISRNSERCGLNEASSDGPNCISTRQRFLPG